MKDSNEKSSKAHAILFVVCVALLISGAIFVDRVQWEKDRPNVVEEIKQLLSDQKYNQAVMLCDKHKGRNDSDIRKFREIAQTEKLKARKLETAERIKKAKSLSPKDNLFENIHHSFSDGEKDGRVVGWAAARDGHKRNGNHAYKMGLRLTGSKDYANGYRLGYNEGWHKYVRIHGKQS